MQLLEKTGCWGKVGVNHNEDEILQYILNELKIYSRQAVQGDMPQKFKRLMNDLFPAFYRGDETYAHNSIGIIGALEGHVSTHLRMAGNNYWTKLIIHKPDDKREYCMVVLFPDRYIQTCTDDLVEVIGQNERKRGNHRVERVEKISDNCRFREWFGIFDIPNLSRIFGCYESAEYLLGRSKEIAGASLNEINVLRTDSLEHKNLVVRRESKKEYEKLLQMLAVSASIPSVQAALPERNASDGDVDLSDVQHIIERFRRLDMRD
ncbi:hypothetical protein HY490_05835 [Candidatus Woesearchaeota archaeon]|nr:hypothetical protein [Candidatus Woesearchaeota archaeon]